MNLASLPMLGWIAGTVALTWISPRKMQPAMIIIVGIVFLGIYSPVSLVFLGVLSMGTLTLIKKMPRSVIPMAAMTLLVVILLTAYKWNRGINPRDPSFAIIPLGLSYYSLRIVHFVSDQWRGAIGKFSTRDFLAYMMFLPTLMAGPINRFQGFARSLRRRRWDSRLFSLGLERILYGYFKIVILANLLVNQYLVLLIQTGGSAGDAWILYLKCVKYGLNLYFQFAGYSDIAIGFALLLGFRVEENFHFPFLAVNINDFWKRWHITLSSWCRDYIYITIRAIRGNAAVAVILAMLVLGVWHEFSWRYIIWGLYHGVGIALWQGFQWFKPRFLRPFVNRMGFAGTFLAWALTMNFVILGFAIAKAPDLSSAWRTFRIILHLGG